jgi:HEPN domain-containing protein
MIDPVRELAHEWLDRAEHDLRVAEYVLSMPDAPPESIGFHAQQCAEKALKGFLISRRVPFERRHDLNYLIDLCMPHEPGFGQFRAAADELTPYAVEFRYPDAPSVVSLDSARTAVAIAERVYRFVLVRLP